MTDPAPNAADAEWEEVLVFGSAPPDEPATVRPSAYGLIIDPADQLPVVRTPQGFFLPGGGIEPGETPGAAVVREVLEECGLEVRIGTWSIRAVDFVYSPTEHTHFEKQSTFVDAHPSGRHATPTEPDHELEWLPPQVAMATLAHPSHRWAVQQWLNRSGATIGSR